MGLVSGFSPAYNFFSWARTVLRRLWRIFVIETRYWFFSFMIIQGSHGREAIQGTTKLRSTMIEQEERKPTRTDTGSSLQNLYMKSRYSSRAYVFSFPWPQDTICQPLTDWWQSHHRQRIVGNAYSDADGLTARFGHQILPHSFLAPYQHYLRNEWKL